jgi:Replication-relaxation
MRRAWEKIIVALAEFDYLTASQLALLLYSLSSITYVYEQMKSLVAQGHVLTLGGRAVNLPQIYTLSGTGRHYASMLGATKGKRFRPSEEADKGRNPYFLKHTIAVTDVLIAARLSSERVPAIRLPRMYTERQLKRKIYIPLAGKTVCLEPDAGLLFRITETWHEPPQTWEDFFHIEVYRNLPPQEWRFKQKIAGYVTYVDNGHHEALFHTPALSIAIIAATEHMTTTLKRWTEEVLTDMERQAEGEWFFFCSVNPASASPEELYLSPVWEQAFSNVKTPLLVLE